MNHRFSFSESIQVQPGLEGRVSWDCHNRSADQMPFLWYYAPFNEHFPGNLGIHCTCIRSWFSVSSHPYM